MIKPFATMKVNNILTPIFFLSTAGFAAGVATGRAPDCPFS